MGKNLDRIKRLDLPSGLGAGGLGAGLALLFVQARVDARDVTMQYIERFLNVKAAGTIHQHTVQYGKRGAPVSL